MRSLKAIIAGIVFIVIVMLLMQLAYIFVAVGYNSLAKHYPLLNDISGYFKYMIGMPVFIFIMFLGGYITASIAHKKILLHCLAVGFITAGGTIVSAMQNSYLTMTGIAVFILSLAATAAGGLYWLKDSKTHGA